MWVGTVAGWLDSIKTCDLEGLARLSDHARLGKQAAELKTLARSDGDLYRQRTAVFSVVPDAPGTRLRSEATKLSQPKKSPERDGTVTAARARQGVTNEQSND
jgi:hypothetical protein